MKELDIDLDLSSYKKQALGIFSILACICIVYFGLDLALSFIMRTHVGDLEFIVTLWSIFFFGVSLITGLFLILIALATGIKLYQIATYSVKYHFKVSNKEISLRSPLDYKDTVIQFENISKIKLELKGSKAILHVELEHKGIFNKLFTRKRVFEVFFFVKDFSKLKDFIIKNKDNTVTEIVENGKIV